MRLTLLALLLAFGLTACAASKSSQVLIGVAAPLSGPNAAFGDDVLGGAKLAVAEANAQGGLAGRRVELVPADDQADPRQAVIVAQKLVNTPGLVGVIGHANSGASLPASAIYQRAGLAMITPASTSPLLTEQGFHNVFRVAGRDDQQGRVLADFALKRLKTRTVAILHDKTAYGQGLAQVFNSTMVAGGARVVLFAGIAQGDKDFRATLTRIKGFKPDLLFFGGVYTEAGLLVNQAREVGLTASVLAGDGVKIERFIQILGRQTDRIYVSSVAQVSDANFTAAYRKTNAQEPGPYSPYAYDATRILLAAATSQDWPERQAVLERVAQTKDFPGLGGTFTFDSKGDLVKAPFQIFRIVQGKFVPFS
ncbi:branched-chain amino acid ABC transporter substrate-binding protein [Anthocerotibacter panamensis]|uniref:branched-chain amino acid ABC transporter substrate-binding protein n=1 Tax=Anthocerotibacter panamensis TaxID=2857077 RepID=UPI001C403CE9|nr:branched-chain amino acid ABC transporter substrate-binding protein [Anthocerotibacter panamensis]